MRPLEIVTFKDATDALIEMFRLENEYAGTEKDIVLVRGNRKDVRNAFRNYFTDATDFVTYIDYAIFDLANKDRDLEQDVLREQRDAELPEWHSDEPVADSPKD